MQRPSSVIEVNSSALIRTRQLRVAERIEPLLRSLGVTLYDDDLFLPKQWVDIIDASWLKTAPTPVDGPYNVFKEPRVSHHTHVQRAIFGEKRYDGDDNRNYLPACDPIIMRMARGIIDEYMQCEYWAELAWKQFALTQDAQKYRKVLIGIEGVRSHIASFYIKQLKEDDYPSEYAIKIVGNSVKAAIAISKENHWKLDGVEPGLKPNTPDKFIHAIDLHAQKCFDEAEKFCR